MTGDALTEKEATTIHKPAMLCSKPENLISQIAPSCR